MTKLKTPLLSLGAKGSIAKTLSFQRYSGFKRVIKRPVPPDQKTLAQIYQRARFLDASQYWHSLSPAQKDQYRIAGGPFHRTAYQQLLSVYLADPIDQQLWLRLDETAGATLNDSSGKDNHAALVGTVIVPGILSWARSFDGLDDNFTVPNNPSIKFTDEITVMLWINLSAVPMAGRIGHQWTGVQRSILLNHRNDGRLMLGCSSTGANAFYSFSTTYTPKLLTWTHIAAVFIPNTSVTFYQDGEPVGLDVAGLAPSLHPSTLAFELGSLAEFPDAAIDDYRIYTRALTRHHIRTIYEYQRHPP